MYCNNKAKTRSGLKKTIQPQSGKYGGFSRPGEQCYINDI